MASSTSPNLPSMPGAVLRLLQVFSDPEVSIDEVVDILRTDPALASRILKAANSPLVGASRPTSDLRRATMMLGKKTTTTLGLSFSLEDRTLADGVESKFFRRFWVQSFVTGISASLLARQHRCADPDEAFVVGLLARIGRLGALTFAGDEYTSALELGEQSGQEVDRVELLALGRSCEELTQDYLHAWNLPDLFREQIAAMTESADEDRHGATDRHTVISELQASELFRISMAVGSLYVGENAGIALATLHELLGALKGETEDQLDELMADVLQEFSGYAHMLDVPAENIGTAASLRDQATAQLIEISMRTEAAIAPEKLESGQEQSQSLAQPLAISKTVPMNEMHSEMEWLRRRVKDLAQQLTLDRMTGVFNRQYFDRHLESVIAVCRASETPASILFVDVNKFKHINDTFGHQAGDTVICSVARALAENVRENDIVARYGGDEFVVLCQTTQLAGLDAQANRISELLSPLTVQHDGQKIQVFIAIGGATGIPSRNSDFSRQLLREADLAMYDVKDSGNRPVVRILSHVNSENLTTAVE